MDWTRKVNPVTGATSPRSADTHNADVPLTVPTAVASTVRLWVSAFVHDKHTSNAPIPNTGTLHARSTSRLPQPFVPLHADVPGLQFFFAYRLQHPVLEQGIGQHLL